MNKRTKGKKPTGKKRPARKVVTTRSTAGPGFNFEDQVGAWLLTKMLRGSRIPGIHATGTQLQMQTRALGWEIDDMLVSDETENSEIKQLAVSCKSNVQVTSSGLPEDFVAAAWQQWGKDTGHFRRGIDCLALVTRGSNAAFDSLWSDLRNWCADGDSVSAIAKITATAKHTKVFKSVKEPATALGMSVSDEDVIRLICHLHVIPLDLQLAYSETEQSVITHCREILRSSTAVEGQRLWEALIRITGETRLRGGTIRLPDLWRELRKEFNLKDHPDFSSSWDVLSRLTADYKATIETSMPTGFTINRVAIAEDLVDSLSSNKIIVLHGNSGCGKSALIKSVLNERFSDYEQVWLRPEDLDEVLSERKRVPLGLLHPLLKVLANTSRRRNVLVIDAAEHIGPDCQKKAKKLIADLLADSTDQAEFYVWRVIISGQTESWANGKLQELSGTLNPKVIELSEAQAEDVKAALRSSKQLGLLAFQDEAVAALTNPRALSWVIEAESIFQHKTPEAISVPAIADRLWVHWTDGKTKLQSLLIKLAEREASFERSFALSELDLEFMDAFDERPQQFPLRLNTRENRFEFQHDLAADWARFQRLKEIARQTTQWAAFASNPLWHNALRMLGQFLLREPGMNGTAWDTSFEAAEKAKPSAPLAADILLDALCLDPLAERFLSERADLLFQDHGARLNRLLRRFHHIATVPRVPEQFSKADPSLQLYLESQHREPIYGRWPRVAKFLANHKTRVADLMSPVVAKLCETWLTTTPPRLATGDAMPFRKEFAEMALASARAVQIAQGKGVMFMDESAKPIYAAAFSAATDLPDEVGEWTLEMARRRPFRTDIAEALTEFRKQKDQEHAKRLSSDAAYRKLVESRKDFSVSIPSGRALPPWPLGPTGRVENHFSDYCLHSHALAQLMKERPAVAAEVLLASIIEDSPEEPYSRSPRSDWDLGLKGDHAGYPTAFWKSPFFMFLQIASSTALEAILKLINFCTERWEHEWRYPEHIPHITIILENGSARVFKGDFRVLDWAQSNSLHSGQLHSALAALERWLCIELDKDIDVTQILAMLLENSNSVSVLGVLINVGKYRQTLYAGPLRPLLGNHALYKGDDYRMEALESHFDAFNWAGSGDMVFQMAKQWTLAPYRQMPLLEIAKRLINSDANTAAFVAGAVRNWPIPSDTKASLEFKILVAQLDPQNYTAVRDAQSDQETLHFQYSTELQSEIAAFQQAALPSAQALLIPYQCEKILPTPRLLTDSEAEMLATALVSVSSGDEEETIRIAQAAIASTLLTKAALWLNAHPDVLSQVDDIVDRTIASIGETKEYFQTSSFPGRRRELKFVAFAVMHRWLSKEGEWDHQVLRILTSGDAQAVSTLLDIASANQDRLRSKWWRLLQLGLLWAGLSELTPRFKEAPGLEANWVRWLRWLRSRKLNANTVTANSINPLAIANRVERLMAARWRRTQDKRGKSPRRHSAGLDTPLLEHIFSWLLNDTQENQAAGEQDRRLARMLWDFEVWRRHDDVEDDGEHGPPSQLGYAVLQKLARLVLTFPREEAVTFWRPVLELGGDGHYSVQHFLNCWFLEIARRQDRSGISHLWRAMLEFAQGASNWTSGRRWYREQQLFRQLLGFDSEVFAQSTHSTTLVAEMRDMYEKWALKHLPGDEDNIAGFCRFLASNAGAVIRLEGLLWLKQSFDSDGTTDQWRREHTGKALIDFLDVIVSQEVQTVLTDQTVRQALVTLAAKMVARQVPAALALQERIRRMH